MFRFILPALLVFAMLTASCAQTPMPLDTEGQSSSAIGPPLQNTFLEHYSIDKSLEGIRAYFGKPEQEQQQAPAPLIGKRHARVALLLPLSGPSSAIGKSLQQAAELALFQTGTENITLIPLDTKDTPEDAIQAANTAIAEHADIIVGPLFSQTTEAVLPIVKERSISMLSFSNSASLLGKGVFLLGFSPQQQIHRVVEYAYKQGFRSFSALAPDDAYGRTAVDEMATVIGAKGLPVRDAQFYRAADENLSESIRGIIELSHRKEGGAKVESLLIPEGGQTLAAIAKRLTYKGNDSGNLQLIGSGQWDDQDIIGNPGLVGGWFATSDPMPRKRFEDSYRQIYGQAPHRLASLAYDAIALCAVLAKEEEPDFSPAAIKNSRGFTGVNGAFRFYRSELAERLLAVVEVGGDGFRVISPAPSSFSLF